MLRRDFIMKLIQQLMDSLFLLLNEKGLDDDMRKAQLEKFYGDYVGQTQTFYLNASIEEISGFLDEKYGDEEVIYRMEMLSEIMYQDGMLEKDIEVRNAKLLKTLSLLDYLNEYSNTYSVVREGKIEEIKSILQ